MSKRQIHFEFSAPYLVIGEPNKLTRNLWIIFHGYGQLAEDFAGSFSFLYSKEHILIFPQGLSKFYLRGIDKKIGASWMTAHDRMTDIENYLSYLEAIYHREVLEKPRDVSLRILGFSQGAHTASRWIYRQNIAYDQLILWGAGLADEISSDIVKSHFSSGKNVFVAGDTDRYITPQVLGKMQKKYDGIGFSYDLVTYTGGHEIYPEILAKLI